MSGFSRRGSEQPHVTSKKNIFFKIGVIIIQKFMEIEIQQMLPETDLHTV